jgi:UDP-N-acetylmuramate--alanine ligase
VISDYAHHPSEIRSTLAAARDLDPGGDIWVVWQPHTYSRTKLLFKEFTRSFNLADHVLVTEIYASREPVDTSYSASQVVEAMIHPHVVFTPGLKDAELFLEKNLEEGDLLIILSAGNADQICSNVLYALGCEA